MKVKQKKQKREKNIEQYLLIFNALKRKNMIFADIARALEMSNACVTRFCYGLESNSRIKNWVKENLGIVL